MVAVCGPVSGMSLHKLAQAGAQDKRACGRVVRGTPRGKKMESLAVIQAAALASHRHLDRAQERAQQMAAGCRVVWCGLTCPPRLCQFPVVGIPLPFFSYGGSSLVSLLVGIGIVMNVQMRRFTFTRDAF